MLLERSCALISLFKKKSSFKIVTFNTGLKKKKVNYCILILIPCVIVPAGAGFLDLKICSPEFVIKCNIKLYKNYVNYIY